MPHSTSQRSKILFDTLVEFRYNENVIVNAVRYDGEEGRDNIDDTIEFC